MRQLTAILLILSLGCQSLVKLGIVAWFGMNQDYIARTLCENRDKPQMKCCGKCYLKKQLRKADTETQKQNGTTAKSGKTELLSFVLPAHHHTLSVPRVSAQQVQHPGHSRHHGVQLIRSIFHPPAVFCV